MRKGVTCLLLPRDWLLYGGMRINAVIEEISQHRERQRIGGNDGCSGLGGISNYSPNWWRNWSSTALARRKGTYYPDGLS
ncbi:BnaC03g47930D [Brassica napus]|uniref:BnaC03g47930D protein n=1 Tax=Brassica napus TaxID=3708 RepID=A0A078F445_BRANA|nr:BnaC03g47930D [Brassica napus]